MLSEHGSELWSSFQGPALSLDALASCDQGALCLDCHGIWEILKGLSLCEPDTSRKINSFSPGSSRSKRRQ